MAIPVNVVFAVDAASHAEAKEKLGGWLPDPGAGATPHKPVDAWWFPSWDPAPYVDIDARIPLEVAHDMCGLREELAAELRDDYYCAECDGEGQLYPDGCWHPCCECFGTGYVIPDEDDIDPPNIRLREVKDDVLRALMEAQSKLVALYAIEVDYGTDAGIKEAERLIGLATTAIGAFTPAEEQ